MTTIEEPVNEYECMHHLPIRTDKDELLDICLRDPVKTRCDGFNINCVDYKMTQLETLAIDLMLWSSSGENLPRVFAEEIFHNAINLHSISPEGRDYIEEYFRQIKEYCEE